MKCFLLAITLMFAAIPAIAADIDGKWVGTVEGQDGKPLEMTFIFKAEGETLIGTLKSRYAERKVLDGKIDGNTITFKIQTDNFAIYNTGTLSGDEIKLVEKIGNDTLNVTLKRVK